MALLAHANLARARGPLDGPRMAAFVRAVGPVNALAERAAGFVWRFRDEDDPEVAARVFGAPDLVLNLSVWTSVDALRAFTYGGAHSGYLLRRAAWFAPTDHPPYVLWWVEDGHRPTPEEARDRLARLGAGGPSPQAFTFSDPYAPPTD